MLIVYLLLFVFGLCIGSFLGVLSDRLPRDESPFGGRSHCDHCKHKLSAFDLVPLISFFVLQERCRYCRHKLSWEYPTIELITGFLFVFTFLFFQHSPLFLSEIPNSFSLMPFLGLLIILCSLLVILIADLKYLIIPDEMLLALLVGAFLYRGFVPIQLVESLTVGFVSFGFFWLIAWASQKFYHKEGMGFGDVKLAGVLGFLLGFPTIIIAFYTAFLTGAAVSIILVLLRHKKWQQQIAFGPFLVLGAVVALFWGGALRHFILAFIG